MARIEPLPMREIVDEEIRHLCEDAERQTGISTSPRTYAKNPAAFKALGAFRAALSKESTLDPVLREERLEAAIEQWRGVLEHDPKHANARRNIEQAERMLRTLAAQPKP